MLNFKYNIKQFFYLSPGILRLLLAIVVVLHHTLGFFAFGSVAVYLFFSLSGYWIARLWDEKYSKMDCGVINFYLSRWLRLLPVFLCVISIYIAISCYYPKALSSNVDSMVSDPIWWIKNLSIAGITSHDLLIGPAWSLAVEMQFYFVFPLIAVLSKKRSIIWVSLFFLSFAFGIVKFIFGTPAVSCNVFIFLPYFIAGIFYYKRSFFSKLVMIRLVLFYTVATCVIFCIPSTKCILSNYPGKPHFMVEVQNLWFFLSTFLLVPFALSSVATKSSRLDRSLGDLAYPLYLFHCIPVYLYYYFRDQIEMPKIFQLVVCWILCFLGSLLIYIFVDRPFEFLRRQLVKKNTLSGSLRGS